MQTAVKGLVAFLGLFSLNVLTNESDDVCVENCDAKYTVNQFWTTEYGTAAADVGLHVTNFLTCPKTTYALCAHSGPASAPASTTNKSNPVLPCTLSDDKSGYANCRCYVEDGVSYILINGISNTEAYVETVRVCGVDGAGCQNMASDAIAKLSSQMGIPYKKLPVAPACNYINADASGSVTMAPDAELVSTFSTAQDSNYHTVSPATECTKFQSPYAGCMTASCTFELDSEGHKNGFANCRCPLWEGPFQVGMADFACDLGDHNIWSSAYFPKPD